jgi:hypothetical protein
MQPIFNESIRISCGHQGSSGTVDQGRNRYRKPLFIREYLSNDHHTNHSSSEGVLEHRNYFLPFNPWNVETLSPSLKDTVVYVIL